jgi:hypothetical protein
MVENLATPVNIGSSSVVVLAGIGAIACVATVGSWLATR